MICRTGLTPSMVAGARCSTVAVERFNRAPARRSAPSSVVDDALSQGTPRKFRGAWLGGPIAAERGRCVFVRYPVPATVIRCGNGVWRGNTVELSRDGCGPGYGPGAEGATRKCVGG